MTTRTNPRTAGLVLAALGLTLAACSGGGDDAAPTTPAPETTTTVAPTTTARPTTTVERTTTTTTEPEVIRIPLTGEPIDDEALIPDRPALVVKIDNHPAARPQSGLNAADIVFEENAEGITRFAAVFHTQDSDPVGPIRSGRSQDVDMLAPLNEPLFAWSGGNPGVRRLISDSTMVNLDAGFTPGYYRRSGRGGAPHDLYSSTQALWMSTPPDYQIPDPIFNYTDPDEQVTGDPATYVDVPMIGLGVRWEYDPEAGVYRRFQNGVPHEAENAGQVVADNVVVMDVEYRPSRIDARSPEAQTVDSGPVYIFSDGIVRTGTWIRFEASQPYAFVKDLAAEELEIIPLTPGRTWVELHDRDESTVTWGV